jgi:glycosyltransferase involved in cell wall biosynthesis
MVRDLAFVGEYVLKEAEVKHGITTSVIIPAYNEERGLPVVLDKLFRAVDGVCEVLVIDDGSNDATSDVASGFRCGVIKHEKNRGKGEALKTGIKYSKGGNVVFIDADDTYPADAIPQMVEALESCDVVYCSRSIGRDNIPRFNRLGNKVFQSLIRYVYGFRASDYATGLYGIKKRYLKMMDIDSCGFAIEPEIAIKASRMKLRVKEIPIEYRPRLGKAKLSGPKAGIEHLKIIVSLLLWRPPTYEEA